MIYWRQHSESQHVGCSNHFICNHHVRSVDIGSVPKCCIIFHYVPVSDSFLLHRLFQRRYNSSMQIKYILTYLRTWCESYVHDMIYNAKWKQHALYSALNPRVTSQPDGIMLMEAMETKIFYWVFHTRYIQRARRFYWINGYIIMFTECLWWS